MRSLRILLATVALLATPAVALHQPAAPSAPILCDSLRLMMNGQDSELEMEWPAGPYESWHGPDRRASGSVFAFDPLPALPGLAACPLKLTQAPGVLTVEGPLNSVRYFFRNSPAMPEVVRVRLLNQMRVSPSVALLHTELRYSPESGVFWVSSNSPQPPRMSYRVAGGPWQPLVPGVLHEAPAGAALEVGVGAWAEDPRPLGGFRHVTIDRGGARVTLRP